ncbi:RIIa domain-containing protein 1 [Nematolebias whitei]|uniref:RIIa domain-containing protein 1 n=1 Tax=Nematolebias whitei TaxID=451745 RepID=UPI00189A5CCA|nr:RIIa domain-containing protein 1 [Nematolebias whitei]
MDLVDGKGVLSAEQQEKLRQLKMKIRTNNENYLRTHPEVKEMLDEFLRKLLLQKPADVFQFAADHFTNLNNPTGALMGRLSDSE